jgi:hypothetical protein
MVKLEKVAIDHIDNQTALDAFLKYCKVGWGVLSLFRCRSWTGWNLFGKLQEGSSGVCSVCILVIYSI